MNTLSALIDRLKKDILCETGFVQKEIFQLYCIWWKPESSPIMSSVQQLA